MNSTAMLLWPRVDGQWRFSPGGAVVLDILAVAQAMKSCGVPQRDREAVEMQLLSISRMVINQIRAEEERKKP